MDSFSSSVESIERYNQAIVFIDAETGYRWLYGMKTKDDAIKALRTISRGGVLAHCRGFGTCGWTDVGGTSTRTKFVGPTALAARRTLYVSGALPQRPVGCPSTLVREVGLLRPKPTRIPVAGSVTCHPRRRGRPAGWTKSPGTNLPTT